MEPYVPYIPDCWNGALVLSEAQNHGIRSIRYVEWLRTLSPTDLRKRLYLGSGEAIGIQPWDDCTLKIVVSLIGLDPGKCAVSNAVPWSRVGSSGANSNPSGEMTEAAVGHLKKMLAVMNPTLIVTAGTPARKIAHAALDQSACKPRLIALRSASPTLLNKVVGMFAVDDLLNRFPEVKRLLEEKPAWFESAKEAKVFYACHALSMAGPSRSDVMP